MLMVNISANAHGKTFHQISVHDDKNVSTIVLKINTVQLCYMHLEFKCRNLDPSAS